MSINRVFGLFANMYDCWVSSNFSNVEKKMHFSSIFLYIEEEKCDLYMALIYYSHTPTLSSYSSALDVISKHSFIKSTCPW
jgi:hypothetical protein